MKAIIRKYCCSRFILTAIALLFFIVGAGFYWFYTVEDAFINFRYCENMLQGKGLVFNHGERVEGYTNFLWILVLALPRLILPFPLAAKIPGLVSGVLLIYLLSRMSYNTSSKNYSGAVAALIVAVCPGFHMWSVAGLETVLFTLLIVSGVYFHEKDSPETRFVSGVMFGLSTLTRPEGILFFGIFLVTIMFINRNKPGILLNYIAGYLLIIIPHIIFRAAYYNAIIPNTYWVKGHRFKGGGLAYFQRYAAMTGVFIIPVAFSGLLIKSLFRSLLPLVAMGTGYLFYVYRIGGDWMPYGRFLLPAIPLFALAAGRTCMNACYFSSGSARSVYKNRPFRLKPVFVFLTILSIVVSGVSAGYDLLRLRPTRYRGILHWENRHMQDWKTVGVWFRENYSDDTYLSTGLAGVIPYYTGFETLDRGGLNDREIARIIYHSESYDEEKQLVEQVILKRKPDIVMIESLSFSMLRPSPVISREILPDNQAFLSLYDLRTSIVKGRYFSYYRLIDASEKGIK
jgi:arabinofuranosyltransferase